MTVRNADMSTDIYLQAGSNDAQFRYQIAHEAFHAVCGQRTFHWTHELLAVHFSLLQLRSEGDHANADCQEADLRSQADLISIRDLLAWSAWPAYPAAEIYGCVFVLGQQLVEATSWEDVKRLVNAHASAWLAGLEPELRKRAEAILAA